MKILENIDMNLMPYINEKLRKTFTDYGIHISDYGEYL